MAANSRLVVITYPDDSVAEGVISALENFRVEGLIELDDVVIALKDGSGKMQLHEVRGLSDAPRTRGLRAFATHGELKGEYPELGIDGPSLHRLAESLPTGGAAVCLLVRSSTPEKVVPGLSWYGGTVFTTTLMPGKEQQLKDALGEHALAGNSSDIDNAQ